MAVDYSDLHRRLDDMTEANERYVQQEADYRATTARASRVEAAMHTLASGLAELETTNRDGWPRHSAEERAEGTAQLQAEFSATLAAEDAELAAQIGQAIIQIENLTAEGNDAMGQLQGETLTRALQLRTVRQPHVRMWAPTELWPQIRAVVASDDPANRAAWLDVINERIAELGDNAPLDLTDMANELRVVCVRPETARRLKTAMQRRDRLKKAQSELWGQTRELRVTMAQDELQADPRYARL